jgi:DtxR family transcriptional regulator, Mn-dependent transcriptional regulator
MSNSTEEYLETIYNLTQDGQTATTSAISKRMNIAPASTTEMLRRLADEGYVNYSPYQGVTLTYKGLDIGEKITRKHRLLERFLHDTLKIGNDKVHAEACAMEHTLSDEAEQALCQALKVPYKCPDDDQLIPPCHLNFSSCQECKETVKGNFESIQKRKENVVALSTLKEKQEGTISFIRGENKVLRRLCDMGLTPGTRISISRIAPLKGPVEVSVRGCKLALGEEIACNVFIENPATASSA